MSTEVGVILVIWSKRPHKPSDGLNEEDGSLMQATLCLSVHWCKASKTILLQ